MSKVDWTDTSYVFDIGVNMVDPRNVDKKLGSLNGVIFEGLSVTENYDSNSRVQAKVTTVVKEDQSDGYIPNSRLRIIASVPSKSWSSELITGYVTDIKITNEEGYIKREYSIDSTMWGLLNHKIANSITIKAGSKMIKIWTELIKNYTRMQYSTSNAQDRSFNTVIMYEPGTALSDILFDISEGYSRMDVDGHGRLLLRRYIAPSKQTATKTIDLMSDKALAYGAFVKTSSEWDTPGRYIVTANVSGNSNGKTSQQVISGSYDAPSTHRSSIDTRGYLLSVSSSYSGGSQSPSKTELAELAKKYWSENQNLGIEWTGETVFGDYHAGDIVNLSVSNLSKKKCLVYEVTTELSSFTQKLTLKEV